MTAIGEKLIAAAKEARAVARGKIKPVRIHVRKSPRKDKNVRK